MVFRFVAETTAEGRDDFSVGHEERDNIFEMHAVDTLEAARIRVLAYLEAKVAAEADKCSGISNAPLRNKQYQAYPADHKYPNPIPYSADTRDGLLAQLPKD